MLCRVAGKDTEHLDYIVIPDSTIGRRHALIEYKDYAFWIVDQGSINGTYVNDIPISSEIRLKHGDKVRLHKIEFEFVIPDLIDSAMTMVSNTLLAEQFPDQVDSDLMLDADSVKKSILANGTGLDLSITGDDDSGVDEPESHNEASHPEDGLDSGLPQGESNDETLMPGFDMAGLPAQSELDNDQQSNEEAAPVDVDETIMPGGFENSDDDQTLRPDGLINSNEDIFNVTGPDSDEDEDK